MAETWYIQYIIYSFCSAGEKNAELTTTKKRTIHCSILWNYMHIGTLNRKRYFQTKIAIIKSSAQLKLYSTQCVKTQQARTNTTIRVMERLPVIPGDVWAQLDVKHSSSYTPRPPRRSPSKGRNTRNVSENLYRLNVEERVLHFEKWRLFDGEKWHNQVL